MQKIYSEVPSKIMTIRPLEYNELGTIRQIARATWPVTYGGFMEPEQIRYMLDLMYSKESLRRQTRDGEQVFLLAEGGKSPLGFMSYERGPEPSQPIYLHKLYVLPKAQGMGIGREFVKIATAIAADNDRKYVQLKVHSKNTNAIDFYQRNGFYIDSAVVTDLGHGFTAHDLIMLKML